MMLLLFVVVSMFGMIAMMICLSREEELFVSSSSFPFTASPPCSEATSSVEYLPLAIAADRVSVSAISFVISLTGESALIKLDSNDLLGGDIDPYVGSEAKEFASRSFSTASSSSSSVDTRRDNIN